MLKVITDKDKTSIHVGDLEFDEPIFAEKDGKIVGMFIFSDIYWQLKINSGKTAVDQYGSISKYLSAAAELGYTPVIDVEVSYD